MKREAPNYVPDYIREVCNEVAELLFRKNREYGNSVFDPVRIFSDVDAVEQIKVRLDDKLSRLATRGKKTIKEDTVMDLMGYLVLLRVAERLKAEGKLPGAEQEPEGEAEAAAQVEAAEGEAAKATPRLARCPGETAP